MPATPCVVAGILRLFAADGRRVPWRGGRTILTFLAFGRKISYICTCRGAGRSGLPLIIGTFGPVFRENASNAFQKCTTSISKSTYCILKYVTSPAKSTTCISEKARAECCRRLNTLKSGAAAVLLLRPAEPRGQARRSHEAAPAAGSLPAGCRHLTRAQKKERELLEFPLLAVRTGLEPVTPCVTGMYSNRLN